MNEEKKIYNPQTANGIKHIVTRSNIKGGMKVIDSDEKVGKIIACEDLHNAHVIFEGEGLEVKVYGKVINCGGSGLYCFVEGCAENSESIDPLYYFG